MIPVALLTLEVCVNPVFKGGMHVALDLIKIVGNFLFRILIAMKV